MENILGKTSKFKTPSGFEITIREQTGEDDEVISKMKNNNDGSAINKFVASIIVECSLYPGKKLTANEILKWKVRDKYYTLFKSRMFSLGEELIYKHKCSNINCNKESDYEEDLKPYDRDFSLPEQESKTDFKYQVIPYKNGELTAEFRLSSGKEIKYKYLSGLSEKKLLDFNKEEISKNTELVVREIELLIGDKWQLIENFKVFSAREMSEIRKHIKENDLPFEAISECQCPFCSTIDQISLMAQPDFFFPAAIS